MHKHLFLFLVTLLLSSSLSAQTANYDLAARFSQNKISKMVFSTQVQPSWFPDSDKFWYVYETSQGKKWYVVDPAQGSKRELFDNDKLAAQLTEITKDPCDAQHLSLNALKLKDSKTFTFNVIGTEKVAKKDDKKDADTKDTKNANRPQPKENRIFYFEYDWATQKLTWLEDEEKKDPVPMWANISPNKEYVIFSRNFNLYWMDWENFEKARKDDKDSTIVEHQLTTCGTADFPFGSGSDDIYADSTELNKRTGVRSLCWSPDSKHFAMVRNDFTGVKDLWVINSLSQPRPTLERYKYEMPGEEHIPQSSLVVFNMEDKTWKTLNTAAFKDQSLGVGRAPGKQADVINEFRHSVWLGDNNSFYVERSSRDLHRIDLCKASLDCDTLVPLVEERLNTYIETRNTVLVNDGKEFVHWSERTGWAHIYLYAADGTLKNAITQGPWHVERVLGVDDATRTVFFTACGREEGDPYFQHVYRAKLDGSEIKLLTNGEYHFVPNMCDSHKYFVINWSRPDAAPVSDLYDQNGRKILNLENTDLSLLFEAGYKFPERIKVKAADGVTDLYGVMYKPFDFDPEKKYPIIDYVYPGPQVEGPDQIWSNSMDRLDRLAQIGFVVITVGNRGGHPNRSKWYHNYGYGNLRDYGLEDQKYAIEQLAARHNFIDISRVGIHGHSGGGFMSTAALLTYPDFFKVAVSCSGNHENNIYNRWWSETHHGVTEEVNAQGDTTFKYSIDKNSELASRLKGHLLLIHGDIDNNVHPGNTLRLVDALIRANKRFDMLIMPGQRHGYGDMKEYFFWKMSDYYARYLLGDYQNTVDIAQMNND